MKKHIILFALAVVAASACNNKEIDPTVGTLSGHYIGFGDVSIEPVMTKSGDKVLVSDPEELIISDNFSLSGNVTVEPIGAGVSTKAVGDKIAVPGEITRDNLPSFYVDGFLDATNPHVTEDAHFIVKAPTKYDATATSENRSITGRWFFTPDEKAYQWRNRIQHYFWAYSDYTGNLSATKDALEFDFDTNNMSKDLVVAYHEQYWDDSHVTDPSAATTYHDGEDELRILPFKHAVSAVALQNSITFAKFITDKPADPKDGRYSDNDLGPNEKDEDESTARLELVYAGIQAFTSGHVKTNANSDSFIWSDLGGYEKGVTTAINGTSTYFEIPQLVNTTSDYNENAIAIFRIRDNKLTKTQDFPIKLPRFLSGTDPEYWVAGNYYKYLFNGRFIAPFVPEGSEDGYPANFGGQECEINIPFEPIDFTYLHHINLNWEIMPECQSNGLEIYLFISPTIITHHSGVHAQSGLTVNYMDSPSDFVRSNYDDSTIWIMHLSEKKGNFTITELYSGTESVKFNDKEIKENYSSTDLKGSISFQNIDVSSLSGKNYVYIGYDGGNNSSQCTWVMKNISLEIVD